MLKPVLKLRRLGNNGHGGDWTLINKNLSRTCHLLVTIFSRKQRYHPYFSHRITYRIRKFMRSEWLGGGVTHHRMRQKGFPRHENSIILFMKRICECRRERKLELTVFHASLFWLRKFKLHHNIVSWEVHLICHKTIIELWNGKMKRKM